MSKKLTVFFILLFFCSTLISSVEFKGDKLILQNNLLKKQFSVSEKTGPVVLHSLYSVKDKMELLGKISKPYFEFVINKELVTANDPIWSYQKHVIREMGNGGEEVSIFLQGEKSPVKGLQVILIQQIFANSTVIREQLLLKTPDGKSFSLNKLDNKIHFKFPQYSLISSPQAKTTEIRIGTWADELIKYSENSSYDERDYRGKGNDHNLANCHMFHPQINEFPLGGEKLATKGPLNIIESSQFNWITAYEHASQDSRRGLSSFFDNAGGDEQQGVSGTFLWEEKDEDFHFIGISQKQENNQVYVSVDILRGGYLEGELITTDKPYETVWTASAFYTDKGLDKGREIIRDYLFNLICEKPASRQPSFYYNTWGMQRDLSRRGAHLRDVLNEKKILEELNRAADLGVDLIVLDDGWSKAQGDWTVNHERLPNGLKPIKEECDRLGITLGIWLSPMGIDSTTERYKQHPEWVIKDSKGKPISAQWGHPAFDFVSGFYDLFVQDCKNLIDQGVRFFKWDAINTFNSTLPNLGHGSDKYTAKERRERYEYLLPIYVTRAMKELTDYEPELVIEMDLTEARRCMVGLAPLSRGKYFWMNNGASGYGDYGFYRTKSMRTIVNRFAGIIPLELFTFATYPHANENAQRYNVNTTLISGHGFWGALEFTKPLERLHVGRTVAKAKRVLPYISLVEPKIIGKIGSSPEIYELVDSENSIGQVIGFSGSAMNYQHHVKINPQKFLAVLNHSYSQNENELVLPFDFPMPDATREAFILPNNGSEISIVSSTCWLDDVLLEDGVLEYKTGAGGEQVIHWNGKNKPLVSSKYDIQSFVKKVKETFIISIKADKPVQITINF